MQKLLKKLLFASLCCALVSGVASQSRAADAAEKKSDATTEKKDGEKKKRDTYPFRGKIKSLDKTAMTITVIEGKDKEHVISVTSKTKFMKDGKPATMEDGKADEPIGGTLKKSADGKEEAVSIRYGAPEGKKAPAPAEKSTDKK